MDRPGSSAALTPSSAGVASPPECLSGAAADEQDRARSKPETQTTFVAPAKGSEVDEVVHFSRFPAAGCAWDQVSSDLAESDKAMATGTCVQAHMEVTLSAASALPGARDSRVASVRCDAGSSATPLPAPHATVIQDPDELLPVTLVCNCMSVRSHLLGLALPSFSSNMRTSVVEYKK